MTIPRMKTLWLAAVVLVVAPALRAEKLDDWLKKLQDSSASVRREAWQRSEHQGAPAVLPLVKLASGDDSDVRLGVGLEYKGVGVTVDRGLRSGENKVMLHLKLFSW